jgi:opacity protein-like surface antigen
MRHLSIAVIAAASTVAFTQIATAADMPVKAPVYKAPVIAPYNWTGLYIGGNVGYSWGKANTDFNASNGGSLTIPGFAGSESVKPKGTIGGGQIGYNWQRVPPLYPLRGGQRRRCGARARRSLRHHPRSHQHTEMASSTWFIAEESGRRRKPSAGPASSLAKSCSAKVCCR